ncbi:hypothetical protein [Rhodovarius lipocyclicus]|uniref:hypothetical protein n=1 Tax=Rhodovarius lipocyclicus TaxID=268410 RepID=UPI00135783E7|nr:hypothetical protein [Rhodovarius lipocyclicus]
MPLSFPRRWLAALAIALPCLAAIATPAQAQRRDGRVGYRGAAEIWQVEENGRFHRCFALFPGPGGGARIFFTRDREYLITTPDVPPQRGLLTMAINTPRGIIGLDARRVGPANAPQRVLAPLTGMQASQMLDIRRDFTFTVDTRSFRYPLGNATMADIFESLESCTNSGSGWHR